MKCLSGYRKLHARIDVLVNGGRLSPDVTGLGVVQAALAAHEGAAGAGSTCTAYLWFMYLCTTATLVVACHDVVDAPETMSSM